jgi:GT2 family glycosyltransferase
MNAIQRVLVDVDLRFNQLSPAFDRILGPAIRALNTARLATPATPVELVFGQMPESPKYTLIIPLYGRIDFVEYQTALFSSHPDTKNSEVIYVLDDPEKRRELEVLAQSAYERFRIPLRLLMLPSNLGFAPANNVGLRYAHGQYICYLNSDVFPITKNWMERLVDRIEKNPTIGVIGPQLLFEDGSIQHEGCYFRTLPEFGNWTFIDHLNKGRRPSPVGGMQDCDAITGACMVLRRTLAEELGGFDEAFIIGDFEDSDLCLKMRSRGLRCVVDRDVQMYHLERKSQVDPGKRWRMNLTLYNAWLHHRRWFGDEKPGLENRPTLEGRISHAG